MDIPLSHEPRLKWVLFEGNLCEVSEFKDLAPRNRPLVYCPICERPVTLKLGQKVTHHFAHQTEDECVAKNPETAIHLNSKFHIYRQLEHAKEVFTSSSCSKCERKKQITWKSEWDSVEVEYRLDSLRLRPDIALLKDGKIIGAIEVYVTHAIEEKKVQLLDSQNVDWIELLGHEGIYEGENVWTAEKPLDVMRQHPKSPSWICPYCQKAREQAEYERNNRSEIFCALMMDLYYKSGKKFRQVFYVKQAFTNGIKSRLWLEDGNGKVIASESTPITEKSEQRLNEAFTKKHEELKKIAIIVDEEMDWTLWLPGKKFIAKDIDNFPFRYKWDESKSKWELQPNLRWKKLN